MNKEPINRIDRVRVIRHEKPIKCIECGRFCCYETMVMVSFTPDNAFGPEESLFECIDCAEKRKTPKEKE